MFFIVHDFIHTFSHSEVWSLKLFAYSRLISFLPFLSFNSIILVLLSHITILLFQTITQLSGTIVLELL